MGHGQVLLNPKTKAWVDEQNKINKEERPRYSRLYNEGKDLTYSDPQLDTESAIKGQKGGTTATLEKEQDLPQPSHALQEFVKHIADPLVDKGWNLYLKFGKGESQGEQFVQGSSPWEPTNKTNKKEKVNKPQIGKQNHLKWALVVVAEVKREEVVVESLLMLKLKWKITQIRVRKMILAQKLLLSWM